MDHLIRFSRSWTLCLLTVLIGAAVPACGGGDEPGLSNRLWIDHLPSDKRDGIAALFITETGQGGRTFGVYYRGTPFRGGFDAFEWIADPEHEDRVQLRLLQDQQEVELRLERCEPDPKFDYCVLLRGDPQGTERYQSRRRWGARGSVGAAAQVQAIFSEVLAEDPELRAVFGEPQPKSP